MQVETSNQTDRAIQQLVLVVIANSIKYLFNSSTPLDIAERG